MRNCFFIGIMFVLYCAQPITNDNRYDPNYSGGDYRFKVLLADENDTVFAGHHYQLDINDLGEDKHNLFRISKSSTNLSGLTSTEIKDGGRIVFGQTGKCTLIVDAVRLNETVHSDTQFLTVVNPYMVSVDSASLFKADTLLFTIKNSYSEDSTDDFVSVEWFSPRDNQEQKLPFSIPLRFILDKLPDTITVYAEVSDSNGLSVSVDTISVPVTKRRDPAVWIIEKKFIVPINSPAKIQANGRRFSEKLRWESKLNDTVIVTESDYLEFIWENEEDDTLIVTAQNKFGTLGNSDTVLIEPRPFHYALVLNSPEVVYAYERKNWTAEVTEDNIVTTDTSITFKWTVDAEYDLCIPEQETMGLVFGRDVSSAEIEVFAYKGEDSSNTAKAYVTVLAHPPEIEVQVDRDTVATGETVVYHITAVDTISDNGEVDSIYYQLSSDNTYKTMKSADSLVLEFMDAGRQHIRFWCMDNNEYSSDTVTATVYVKSLFPYFIDRRVDTFTYRGESITVAAPANTDRDGDDIVQWRWYAGTSEEPFRITSVDHFDTVFTEGDTVRFRVHCTSAMGSESKTAADINVRVSKGLPDVDTAYFSDEDNFYVNDTVEFNIAAHDSNGTLSMLHVFIDGDSSGSVVAKSSQEMVDMAMKVVLPSDSGSFDVEAVAVDNLGNVSAVYALPAAIRVKLGKPVVTGVSPDTCWINDEVTFQILFEDENRAGAPDHFVRFGPTGDFTSIGSDNTFKHSFTTGGRNSIEAYVVDDDGIASDLHLATVFVMRGEPAITAISTDTALDKIFVNDLITFSLKVKDPNDAKVFVKVSWDGDNAFEIDQNKDTGTVKMSYAFPPEDTGSVNVRFGVEDPDGMTFDTTFTVVVRPGTPVVDAIAADTCDGCLFVGDVVTYKVSAHDDNGTLDKIYVEWGDGSVTDSVSVAANVSGVTEEFTHEYHPSNGGVRTVRAWAKDEDGVVSAVTSQNVSVRYGTPVVTKTEVDTFWVNDDTTVTVQASDTNGTVIRRLADWDRDGVWDDTINGTSFTHAWDTSFGGTVVTYKVQVMDDDSLTGTGTCSAFIRMGRPVLSGGADYGYPIKWKGDTLFYVYTGVKPTIVVDTSDTNGAMQRYYWDSFGDGIDDSTGVPEWPVVLTPNTAIKFVVTGKDDDNLMSNQFTFYGYPDAPPPTTTATHSKLGMPDVRTEWYGLDIKDDSLTQFAVAIDDSSNGAFADTVMSFTEAKDNKIGKSGTLLTYTFNPQTYGISGNFFFKVIARDARGSMPAVITSNLVSYPY